jgi:hypothetical protein
MMTDREGYIYISIGAPSTTPRTVAYSIPMESEDGETGIVMDISEDNELLGIEILRLDLMIAHRSNGL